MSQTLRLGVFIVFALLILSGAIFMATSNSFFFGSTYSLKAEFPTVVGLSEGSDVRVGGVRQGTVKRIILPKRADGKVTVVMDLSGNTKDIVKKDSIASIKSEG